MLRRDVFKRAIGAVAGASLASPAVAQRPSQIRWRMTASFTKTLDITYRITYGAAEQCCRYVGELTEGRFIIDQSGKILLHTRPAGGGTSFHVIASLEKWESLPPAYKKAVVVTAQATTTSMLAHWTPRTPTPCFA